MNPTLRNVTERILKRSDATRRAYMADINERRPDNPERSKLSAGNKAHAFAACPVADKQAMLGTNWPNIAIVTAYNDMLSAHQPYERYPPLIREAARKAGATAQVAGGVPAMCDGVTQGQPGMEMSLFSRDVIAMSTAIALSHNTYDAGLYLGICDKIVPGLLMGALQFGYLPAIFVPSGPMSSGLPNSEKARVRQLYAEGKASREELLQAECESYHGPGTCTFYGTANSNQMLMEFMGLHMPGAAFIPPDTELRDALTRAATERAVAISPSGDDYTPLAEVVSEATIVNAIVGLLATGGSTNHTLHIPAIARAAGIIVDWQDIEDLSQVVPLLARVYPNGQADVNHFHAAGGIGYVIGNLLDSGLLHEDVTTVAGAGLAGYAAEPYLAAEGDLSWGDAPHEAADAAILASCSAPFDKEGGIRLVRGDLGRGIIKTSAVRSEHRIVEAPARVFDSQHQVVTAFEAGELDRDCVVVLRFQGPSANGMPELHKLTPALGALLDRGFKVALITDGRMSGASGKVPAAIHLTPEADHGGPIGLVADGDVIRLDSVLGEITVSAPLATRSPAEAPIGPTRLGLGRDLFAPLRSQVGPAESGASIFFTDGAKDVSGR